MEEQPTLITAENLNMPDVISSGNYSIATIKRKLDGKLFGCYFRSGSVRIVGTGCEYKSWWIAKDKSGEELEIVGVSIEQFDVIAVIAEEKH